MVAKRPALIAASVVGFAICSVSASAQPTPSRAKPGDHMLVVVNVVKADKKQQFEDYVNKFWAALDKVGASDPTVKRTGVQTRFLFPAGANEDGTYTFIFLMDPLVQGADYNMRNILEKALTPEEADRLFQQFTDSVIVEKHMVAEMVQSPR